MRTARTTLGCSFVPLCSLSPPPRVFSLSLQERDPSYYETASISIVVGDLHPLFTFLRAAGGIDDGEEEPKA